MKVTSKQELRKIIQDEEIPLDTIDVSLMTDLSKIFEGINKILGSIADWDTSNVTDMSFMFYNSEINPDLSNWDTSKVINMRNSISNDNNLSLLLVESFSLWGMFANSRFKGDISSWDTSKVEEMNSMFSSSKFNSDISIQANEPWRVRKWDISSVKDMSNMFRKSPFYQNLGAWDFSGKNINDIFYNSVYDMYKYEEDRKEYLEEINNKYLKNEANKVNNELNKEIDLNIIELEF